MSHVAEEAVKDRDFTMWNETRRMHSLRMQMVEAHPFWGYLLLQVRFVPALGLPTFAATDCLRHIWFNPMLTQHLDHSQLGFVLAHEVGHQLLATLPRMGGRDPYLWNCATDFAINRLVDRIRAPGATFGPMYRLPDGTYPDVGHVEILLDRRFDGMVAETIYESLKRDQLPVLNRLQLELPLSSQEGGEAIRVPGAEYQAGGIDVHLPDAGLGDAGRSELAERVGAAYGTWERQEQRGHCPGELVRGVLEARRSVVPWTRLFQSYAGQTLARDDWMMARPNARYLEQGIVVPGPYGDRAGRMVVSVDTSGSISEGLLGQIGAELQAIAKQVESVVIIVSDSAIRQVVEEREVALFLKTLRFRGGGGTDHRPVFEHVARMRLEPDLFVGLTDLQTVLPPRNPGFPVLWVVPKQHGAAPWGKVVVALE